MNKEKIKEFCKKHKKEIILGTVTTTACVAAAVLLKRKVSVPKNLSEEATDTIKTLYKQLPLPEKSVGKWADFWVDGGTKLPTAIVCDVPMQYMGDLGTEILNHCAEHGIDQITHDTHVQMVLEFLEN